MTTALPTPRKAVTLIKAAFEVRETKIGTKEAYNLLAQLWGYKDWDTASAALTPAKKKVPKKDEPTCVLSEDIEGWPVWVMTNQAGDIDAPLYIYPFGTTLDKLYAKRDYWCLINDSNTSCMELPYSLLTSADAQRVVVEEVASEYPDSEEYGVPACACDSAVADFAKEELGFSYLGSKEGRSYVEVHGRCRGDDGMTHYWVQVRVHPDLHARLVKTFTPARCEFEKDYMTKSLPELVAPGQSLWESEKQTLADVFKDWFATMGERPLAETVESLLGGYSPDALASYAVSRDHTLHDYRATCKVGELATALTGAVDKIRANLEQH